MTSCVLPLHGLTMSNGRTKGWRELESFEEAAARLIGVMDERKRKRLAGSLNAPAEIMDQQRSPAENAAGEKLEGSGSFDRQPQRPAAREDACSGLGSGQVYSNRPNAGPSGGVNSVVTTPCPRTDANEVSGGFTVPVLNSNARR